MEVTVGKKSRSSELIVFLPDRLFNETRNLIEFVSSSGFNALEANL